jgi:small-conductance mechanosensitive channel
MIGRIFLTVALLVICFIALQVMEQNVAPSRASDLAIEQIQENGAREQMRIEQNSQNWLRPLLCLFLIGMVIWIWKNPAIKLCKNLLIM